MIEHRFTGIIIITFSGECARKVGDKLDVAKKRMEKILEEKMLEDNTVCELYIESKHNVNYKELD